MELEQAQARAISELTNANLESIHDMRGGFLLSNLLNLIDKNNFPIQAQFNNWHFSIQKLQIFLRGKGCRFVLDVDQEKIRQAESDELSQALSQILALIAVFNPLAYDKLLHRVDHETSHIITSLLGLMIDTIKEDLKTTRDALPKIEQFSDIKSLLRKLEEVERCYDEE